MAFLPFRDSSPNPEYQTLPEPEVRASIVSFPNRLPADAAASGRLKKLGYKTCLVCPERWGRPQDIAPYKRFFNKAGFRPDAAMTSARFRERWG